MANPYRLLATDTVNQFDHILDDFTLNVRFVLGIERRSTTALSGAIAR